MIASAMEAEDIESDNEYFSSIGEAKLNVEEAFQMLSETMMVL